MLGQSRRRYDAAEWFYGQEPWEQLSSEAHRALILDSEWHKKFVTIRGQASVIQVGKDVKRWMDICWRAKTAHWHISPARMNMNQNFTPLPSLRADIVQDVEMAFRDCRDRHSLWVSSVQ